MEEYIVKILNIEEITHDVKRFKIVKPEGYAHGFITEDFLKANVPLHNKNYYLCGLPLMMESIISQLLNLGIRKDLITIEKM